MRLIAASEVFVDTSMVTAFRERFSIDSTASRYADQYWRLMKTVKK